MSTATIRTRWAAVGAAVAVTLGAGGIGLISAAPLSSGERPVLVAANCRLADTRPAPDTVGARNTPIGAGETATFNAHGTNGNCTIPADATALSLNVTALNITAPLTFLTLWNADVAQPTTSSLNPAGGQPPTPNAVTVDISATGQFKVFNALGTLNVIIDVTGYYQDHNHDDRYYTKGEVDARTIVRNLSVPALALNESTSQTVIEHVGSGLEWENSGTEAAELFVRRPGDWAGTGDVVLRLFFRRANGNAGNVQFFVRPRNYDDGDPFNDRAGILSDIQTETNTNFYEVSMTISAAALPKDWWDLVIQRNTSVASPYADPVTVLSAELQYVAST